MILFVKHIDIEGPEILEPIFRKQGFKCRTIDLSLTDQVPENLSGIEALVVLGGPMNVYEEDKFPFLKRENEFIRKILKQEVPFLGICLGSQLLAKASDARVTKSPVEEIGWFNIQLTDSGLKDPIFQNLESELKVFQWHSDTFAIPSHGKWLAKASGCPHQAIKIGEFAYGFQFHMEITDKSIVQWSDRYFKDEDLLRKKKQDMLAEYHLNKTEFEKTAGILFSNFSQIIKKRFPISLTLPYN